MAFSLPPGSISKRDAISCENNGSTNLGPVPQDEYCDRYTEIICEAAQRCDCLGGYSIELCHAYVRPICQDEVDDPVNAGRYLYNPVEGGRCLGAQKDIASDCSTRGDDWPESCDRVLTGNVAEGQSCDADSECIDGLECHEDRCTRLPGENQPCLGSVCADDLFCGNDDRCHRYRGRGEPCPEGSYVCDDDLYCDNRTDTCQSYLRSGESCAHALYACDDDLFCSNASETCRPSPR